MLHEIEVIALFVDDLAGSKEFYRSVFRVDVVYEVAPVEAGSRFMLTIKVPDVDAACSALRDRGVRLLNGPIDRTWGRRTAAFADPSGHVWEVAAEIA